MDPVGWMRPLTLAGCGQWTGVILGPSTMGLLLAGRATRSTLGKGLPWVSLSLAPWSSRLLPLFSILPVSNPGWLDWAAAPSRTHVSPAWGWAVLEPPTMGSARLQLPPP